MKILLFGATGQVGWELQRALAPLGGIKALSRRGEAGLAGNLEDLDGIAKTVRTVRPDLIINAAAYTAVDRAESEPERAHLINAKAPEVLAREARDIDALMVHYSTDYVFDGSGTRPWTEDDEPAPVNVYGRTKLAGEAAVREAAGRHLILRTSWVYASRGENFLRTILGLARERDTLSIVADQIGAPTSAELVADVTAHAVRAVLADPARCGTFHLSAAGEVSWHGYAARILKEAGRLGLALRLMPAAIRAVPTSEYQAPAPRPLNSRLNMECLERTFGLEMPPWEDGVSRAVAELVLRS